MADNLTGVFNEQLHLTVNLSKWKASLEEAKTAWNKFKQDLGKDAESAVTGNSLANIAKSISQLSGLFEMLLSEVKDVRNYIVDSAKIVADAEVKAASESAKKQVEIELEKQEKLKKLKNRPFGLDKTARDIRIEQEGVVNERIAAEQKVSDWWLKNLFLREEAEKKAAARSAQERVKLEQSVNDWWQKALRTRELEEEKVAKRQADHAASRAEAQAKRSVKLYEQEMLGQLRAISAEQNRQRALQAAKDAYAGVGVAERNATLRSQIADATDLNVKLAKIKSLISVLKSDLAALKSAHVSIVSGGDVADINKAAAIRKQVVALQREINSLVAQQHRVEKQITNEKAHHKSLLDRIVEGGGGGGLKGTLAHLIRFYTLWNLINGAVNTFTAIVTAPIKLLMAGWQYMANTERAADDMVGVIASNVKFSKDYLENFNKARDAAKEVTKALQEQAIVTGFSADQIEGTFKALLSSGAARYVKTLREMVGLATMFQMALKAAGAGGLAAQTSIQEMSRLWNGTPNVDNKFLAFVGMDVGQWKQFREEVEKTRDMFPRLAERTKAYRDALIAAGQGQTVLLNNLKLIMSRIAGSALEGLFDKVNSALIRLNKWLYENKDKIAAAFSFIGQKIGNMFDKMVAFFSNRETLEGILTVTLAIAKAWVTAAEAVWMIVKGLTQIVKPDRPFNPLSPGQSFVRGLGNVVGGIGLGVTAPVQPGAITEARKILDDLNKSLKEAPKTGNSILDALFDPGSDNRIGKDSLVSYIVKKYETAREKIEYEIERIEGEYQDKRNALSEKLADNLINKQTYSQELTKIVEEEAGRIRSLRQQLLDETGKTRLAILGQSGADPDRSRDEAERFQKIIVSIIRKIAEESKKARKEISAASIVGIKEEEANERIRYEARIKRIKEEQDYERRLISEAASFGYLTPLQAAMAEAEVSTQQYNAELGVLRNRLNDLAEGGEEWVKVQEEINALDNKRSLELELQARLIERLKVEEEALTATYTQRLRSQYLERQSLAAEQERLLADRPDMLPIEEQLLEAKRRDLELTIAVTKAQLEAAKARNADHQITREYTLQLEELNNKLLSIDNSLLSGKLAGLSGSLLQIRQRRLGRGPDSGLSVRDGIFGVGFTEEFNKATTNLNKFGVGLVGASNALTTFRSVLTAIQQGYREGGVLGGIGAAAGQAGSLMGAFSGKPGSFGALMGALGPYVSAIGAVFSVIGGLFTRAAKKIAESIRKDTDAIVTSFNRDQSTLVETIANLENQRVRAITQLSGRKGGKEELDKLLPQLEDQIYQLKRQQEEILENFNNNLDALRLNSDTLSTIENQWRDINKQVKEYLGAGGDAAKASEYLSLQLGRIRQEAIEQLNEAEQDAIQSIYQLNDLLKQRQDLINDFKRNEFDLMNADALERRQAGSISRGRQLAELRKQHQEELERIDQDIYRLQVKVDKEKEIFNLVNDTASLRRRDEELTLAALDAQIQKLKDLQSIVSNINLGAGGYIGTGMFGPQTVSITVDVSAPVPNPSDFGREIGNSLADEFLRRMRMTPSYA